MLPEGTAGQGGRCSSCVTGKRLRPREAVAYSGHRREEGTELTPVPSSRALVPPSPCHCGFQLPGELGAQPSARLSAADTQGPGLWG